MMTQTQELFPNQGINNASGESAAALNHGADDVTAPQKAIVHTFPARLFLASAVVGPYWVLHLMWVANRFLPADDAANFKNLLITCLTSLIVGSGGGAVLSSLMSRWGKVAGQIQNLAAAAATAANVTAANGAASKP